MQAEVISNAPAAPITGKDLKVGEGLRYPVTGNVIVRVGPETYLGVSSYPLIDKSNVVSLTAAGLDETRGIRLPAGTKINITL